MHTTGWFTKSVQIWKQLNLKINKIKQILKVSLNVFPPLSLEWQLLYSQLLNVAFNIKWQQSYAAKFIARNKIKLLIYSFCFANLQALCFRKTCKSYEIKQCRLLIFSTKQCMMTNFNNFKWIPIYQKQWKWHWISYQWPF